MVTVTFVLILICNASQPREDTTHSSITLIYNNTSKTNIRCRMSELHQRNLYVTVQIGIQ